MKPFSGKVKSFEYIRTAKTKKRSSYFFVFSNIWIFCPHLSEYSAVANLMSVFVTEVCGFDLN